MNRLLGVFFEHGIAVDEQVVDVVKLLLEAIEHPDLCDKSLPRPTLSLRRTGLLVNGWRDVQIASDAHRGLKKNCWSSCL